MSQTHFISDLHLGQDKLAKVRGFEDGEAMNQAIRERWSRKVGPKDVVYVLGDVSYMKLEPTLEFFDFLPGEVRIVPGNHDNGKFLEDLARLSTASQIKILPPLVTVKVAENLPDGSNIVTKVVLCHFPLLIWNESHYGTLHLHGHCHGSARYPDAGRRMDVGLEANNCTPISMTEVRERIGNNEIAVWDHHTPKMAERQLARRAANDADGGNASA